MDFRELLNKIDTMVYGDTFKKILMANDKSNFYNEDNLIKVGFNKTSGPLKELPSLTRYSIRSPSMNITPGKFLPLLGSGNFDPSTTSILRS